MQRSGIHTIDEPQRQLYAKLREKIPHLLPFQDCNKIGDEDLAYRFLIARQWNVDNAATMLQEYLQWRQESNIDHVFDDVFPSDIPRHYPMGFHGFDKGGRPVYYEKPNPKGIAYLLQTFDKDTLLRWHYYVIERARERYRLVGQDRLTLVLDASLVGMNVVTNTTSVTFLKVCMVGRVPCVA